MSKKALLILTGIFFISVLNISGQGVTIGSGNAPHNSAVLDLQSTNKGFLPPRVSTLQRRTIPSPAAGLVVFDTDARQLFLYNGNQWIPLNADGDSRTLTPAQQAQATADQKLGGYFGIDVAMSETYTVIGASGADAGTLGKAGAIFIYKKSAASGWTLVGKKQAKDPQQQAYFGGSVAISGNYIIVGAPGFDINASNQDAGKVYVFVKGSGDTWTEQVALTRGTPAAYENFGYCVAVSTNSAGGPFAVASAIGFGGTAAPGRGVVEIIKPVSGKWALNQTIFPTDIFSYDQFGISLDMDGDYLAIGAPRKDNLTYAYADAGAVYVYVYGGGTWSFQKKLDGTTANAAFGTAVSIRGDILAVGGPSASTYSNTTASVYIYKRDAANWTIISSQFLYKDAGYDVSNYLGASVALDNNFLMVSMPAGLTYPTGGSSYYSLQVGRVIVYRRRTDNRYYLYKVFEDNESKIFNTGPRFFGNSVSMKNGNYVIGIPGKMVNDTDAAGTVAFGFIE